MADTVKVQVTLTPETAAKLRALCARAGVTKSAMVSIALTEKYDREEACIGFKNRLLNNAKIKLYKCFKEGDDLIYLIH